MKSSNVQPNIFEIRFNFESMLIIVSTPQVTPVFSVQCSEFRGSRSHEGEEVFPEH
jgi:hypothetical protein